MDRLFEFDEPAMSVSETMTLGRSPDSVRLCGMMIVSLGEAGTLEPFTGEARPLLRKSSFSNAERPTVRLSRAFTRSSARVSRLGGSSRIDSQPTGGEPGGEMRKFLSV